MTRSFTSLHASSWFTASLLLVATSCNFIVDTVPDEVVPCANASECEKSSQFAFTAQDARFDAICSGKQGGGGGLGSSKSNQVCAVNYAQVSCSINAYGGGLDGGDGDEDSTKPFVIAYTEAVENRDELYVPCAGEQLGTQGCPPADNGCNEGLVVNRYGVCDVEGAFLAAYEPQFGDELLAQDVYDQFCRSFFCDERFTCVVEENSRSCRIRDPEKQPGQGGCADMYFAGKRSSVYLSKEQIEDSACTPMSEILDAADATQFGPPNIPSGS